MIIKYQIMDSEGRPVLEPFPTPQGAWYMIQSYGMGSYVLEVEVETK